MNVACSAVTFVSLHMVVAAFARTLRLYVLNSQWMLADCVDAHKTSAVHGFSNTCPDCGALVCFGGRAVQGLNVNVDLGRIKVTDAAVYAPDWVLDALLVGDCADGHDVVLALAHNSVVKWARMRDLSQPVAHPSPSMLSSARLMESANGNMRLSANNTNTSSSSSSSPPRYRVVSGSVDGVVQAWLASHTNSDGDPPATAPTTEACYRGFAGCAYGVDALRVPEHSEDEEDEEDEDDPVVSDAVDSTADASGRALEDEAYVEVMQPPRGNAVSFTVPASAPAPQAARMLRERPPQEHLWVVCAADDRSVRVWSEGLERHVLWGSQGRPWCVRLALLSGYYSPGRGPLVVVAGGEDGALRWFNNVGGSTQDKRAQWTAVRHASNGGVRRLAVCEGWVCAAGDDGSLTLWDTERVCAPRATAGVSFGVPATASKIRWLAADHVSLCVVAGSSLWVRSATGEWADQPCADSKALVACVASAGDAGEWLAFHKDGTARLRLGVTVRPLASISLCDVCIEHSVVLLVSWNGAFAVVNVDTGATVAAGKFALRTRETVTSCAIRPDASCVAVGTSEGAIHLGWLDVLAGGIDELRLHAVHTSVVTALCFASSDAASSVMASSSALSSSSSSVPSSSAAASVAATAPTADGVAAVSASSSATAAALLYSSCRDGRIGSTVVAGRGRAHVVHVARPRCVRNVESVEGFVRCGAHGLVVRLHVGEGAVFCMMPADSPDCVVGHVPKLAPRAMVACSHDKHGSLCVTVVPSLAASSVTEYQWPLANRECVLLNAGAHCAIVNVVRGCQATASWVTACDDGRWALWGRAMHEARLWRKSGNALRAVAWTHDGERVLLASATHAYLWHCAQGRLLCSLQLPTREEGLVCRAMWCVMSTKGCAWVGDSGGNVCALSIDADERGMTVAAFAQVSAYCLTDGCLDEARDALWCASTGGSVLQLDPITLAVRDEYSRKLSKCALMTLALHGSLLVAAGDDGDQVLFLDPRVPGLACTRLSNMGHAGTIVAAVLRPLGALAVLFLLSKDGTVSVWRVDAAHKAVARLDALWVAVQNPTSMDVLYDPSTRIFTLCAAGGTGSCTLEWKQQ